MTRYHIAASGQPAPCAARAEQDCPLGGRHFASKDLAEFYAESQRAPEVVTRGVVPQWLEREAQQAVGALEAAPASAQPTWYRNEGRGAAVAAGISLPPLPEVGEDEQVALQYRALTTTPEYLDGQDAEEELTHPGLALMRDELGQRLAKAEATLQLTQERAREALSSRRLQAKVAGVRYFRESWAPRFSSVESPEEARAFLMDLAATSTHSGYDAYHNEPGFHEGLTLARGYVEDYLRLS